MPEFDLLQTVDFHKRMRAPMDRLYETLYPGSLWQGCEGEPLDLRCGIDGHLVLASGLPVSVQEKVRTYSALIQYGDLTLETRQGSGEAGEWSRLDAQMYVYCWANREETEIAEYLVLDVLQLKLTLGDLADYPTKRNDQHGSSIFACVPLHVLKPSVIASSFGTLQPRPLTRTYLGSREARSGTLL